MHYSAEIGHAIYDVCTSVHLMMCELECRGVIYTSVQIMCALEC